VKTIVTINQRLNFLANGITGSTIVEYATLDIKEVSSNLCS